MYMFTNTINDEAKPKAHEKYHQKTFDTGHLHGKKREEGVCLKGVYFGNLR